MEYIRDCISYQASSAAKIIARLSRARLSPFGVTPIQFAVLQAVSENQGSTAADVGTALLGDSATIVGVIDRLGKMNLLSRQPDPADRRVNRLVLTSDGTSQLPAMQAAMNTLNAEVDGTLGRSAEDVRNSLRRLSQLEETMNG